MFIKIITAFLNELFSSNHRGEGGRNFLINVNSKKKKQKKGGKKEEGRKK